MKHPTLLLLLAALPFLRPQPHIHAAETPITYAHQVAPILYQHCTTCHHPGGAGPFSLLTYQDAVRRAPQILAVTQSRYMPPWLPEPGRGDFMDSRRLSDPDRETLRRWLTAGTPQGDLADIPKPPVYTGEWQLGPPDLILDMKQPFTTPAEGTDVFRNFVLPFPGTETRYIHAVEIRPGGGPSTARAVHHANILLDRTGSYRRQHPADWQQGIPGMELLVDAGNTFDPDSHFLFWKPDSPAIVEQPGLEWRLDPGDDLILNMHLKPTGKPEIIQARIGLYFSPTPPKRQPMLLQLEHDAAIDIPPGDPAFPIDDQFTLPIAVHALGIYPHAHYLGRRLESWAILPGGRKQWLVSIPDWDIDRQSVYQFRAPILLPAATVLHMHFVYDNSAANPRNPHQPPIRVIAGNRSEDEMGHLWLQVLPVAAETNGKDSRLLLERAWMQSRLAKDPHDATALYNLAAATTEDGHPEEAVPLFRRILAQSPTDPRTLTALGAALDQTGDWQQAQAAFAQALTANPDQNDARFNLAELDLAHDHLPEATQLLESLLERTPSDPIAHQRLALAYAQSNRLPEATLQLRQAIELAPQDPAPHNLLSQLEAAQGHPTEAIAEQKQALTLAPQDPDAWNNLGVLEARAHHPAEARKAFERTLALAPTHVEARNNLAQLAPQ